MLERALGVVRRVDVDALHPPAKERKQRLERFEVVALNQQISRSGIAVAADVLQQSIWNRVRDRQRLLAVQPA